MSGGGIRISFDGQDYVMPEDEAKQAMQMLEARGTKFTAQDAPHEAGVYSEPDPNLQVGDQHPPEPPTKPEEKPGLLAGLLDAFGRSSPGYVLGHASAPINAAASGFSHGMTGGLDQNLPGGQGIRDMRAQDAAAAPPAYHGGDILGSLMSPLNLTGGGPLRQAAGGFLQGAARSYSDADPNDPALERAAQAAKAGAATGATAGALGLIGEGIGALANGSRAVGDASRLRAWNTPAAAIENYADQNGLDASQAVRQFVDRGEQLVPPNVIVPRPTAGWETAARPVTNQLGQDVDRQLMVAQAQGAQLPTDPRAELARRLYQGADAKMTSGQGGAVPEANALSNEAAAVARGPQYEDPIALRQAKTAADRYAFRGAPGTPEAAAGQAALQHGNEIRGILGDYVNQAGPDVANRYNQAASDFGVASTIQSGARQGAIAGAPLGGRSIGVMGSAAAMVPKGAIPDAVANTARIAQNTLGAGGGALQAGAPTMAAMSVAKWLGSKGVNTGMPAAPSNDPGAVIEDSTGTGHGNRLGAAAAQMLRQNPQQLGEWLPEFQKADQEGSGAMSALVGRLMQDNSRFRSGPGLQLQQMTR